MGTKEIIREITRLPINRRIFIVEKTLKSIREKEEKKLTATRHVKMEDAVNSLLKDYSANKELTEFTEIDFEKFYEAR